MTEASTPLHSVPLPSPALPIISSRPWFVSDSLPENLTVANGRSHGRNGRMAAERVATNPPQKTKPPRAVTRGGPGRPGPPPDVPPACVGDPLRHPARPRPSGIGTQSPSDFWIAIGHKARVATVDQITHAAQARQAWTVIKPYLESAVA